MLIELAGLPGAGKSTISSLLRQHYGLSRLTLVNTYNANPHRLLLSVPVAPVSLLRTRRLFWSVTRPNAGKPGVAQEPPTSLARTFFRILAELNVFTVGSGLARLEAFLRGKRPVLDGGFVQRGLAVWLRTPPHARTEAWRAYLSHVPQTVICIILQCEPTEALRRAKSRPDGLPAVLRTHAGASVREEWLIDEYRQMAALLSGEMLNARVRCIHVNAEMPPRDLLEVVVSKLETMTTVRDLMVQ